MKLKKKCEKIYSQVTYWLGIVVVGLAVGLSIQFVVAWVEPTVAPPGGNLKAPLNVSGVGQVKEGGLMLNTGGAATGLIVDKGNVGIGTTSPNEKLVVNGKQDMMMNNIINVADPVKGKDAVNKDYVDAHSGGGGNCNYTQCKAVCAENNNAKCPSGWTRMDLVMDGNGCGESNNLYSTPDGCFSYFTQTISTRYGLERRINEQLDVCKDHHCVSSSVRCSTGSIAGWYGSTFYASSCAVCCR